jgi:hypothetical protein
MRVLMYRKIQTGVIFGALLLTLLITFVPISSAGIINVPPLINVTYPKQEDVIIPNSGVLDIPLLITAKLTGPWAKFVEKFSLLRNKVMEIELNVVQKPDYCTASISNPLAKIKVREPEPYKSTLIVTVNENAPAFKQVTVKISATSKIESGLIFNIAEETVEFDINFIAGYWCVVGYNIPGGTLKEIKSDETTDFQIDIENIGNGATLVEIELIDEPKEGWSANIASTVQLASAVTQDGDTKKTVHLKIHPPTKSDKNKIRKTFGVRFTPSYLGRPELKGQTEILFFNVEANYNLEKESESENNLLIILGTVIFLIILISIFLKWRKTY